MPVQPIFTVVDLNEGDATGINRNGCVSLALRGFSAAVFIPQSANSAQGTVVPLAPSFGITAEALALNNLVDPDVVGWAGIQLPIGTFQQAALWPACTIAGSQVVMLPTLTPSVLPPGLFLGKARALAINDAKVIVGWSETPPGSGFHRAVVWDPNTPVNPRPLQALDNALPSEALGINNNGQIVGLSQVIDAAGNAVFHAVVWDTNTLQITRDLGNLIPGVSLPGIDLHAKATAINDIGTIVGTADVANSPIRPRAAFIVPAGAAALQPIVSVPSANTGAWAIAPNGVAALTIAVAGSPQGEHGATFSLVSGIFDIDQTTGGAPPGGHGLSGGWIMTQARGVNDHGEVCGRATAPGKMNHALLIVP